MNKYEIADDGLRYGICPICNEYMVFTEEDIPSTFCVLCKDSFEAKVWLVVNK
jgi:hypothetical protein